MNFLATLKFFFTGYCTQFPTNSNAHETFSLLWSEEGAAAALKRFSTYEFSLVCVSCASTTVLQQQCFIFQLFIKWTKKILKGKPSPKFLQFSSIVTFVQFLSCDVRSDSCGMLGFFLTVFHGWCFWKKVRQSKKWSNGCLLMVR